MKQCTECGQELQAMAKFCAKCAAEQPQIEVPGQHASTLKGQPRTLCLNIIKNDDGSLALDVDSEMLLARALGEINMANQHNGWILFIEEIFTGESIKIKENLRNKIIEEDTRKKEQKNKHNEAKSFQFMPGKHYSQNIPSFFGRIQQQDDKNNIEKKLKKSISDIKKAYKNKI